MAASIRGFFVFICLMLLSTEARLINEETIPLYRKRVEAMFHHAYDSYIKYAYPYDELRPLTCDGHDTWGSYSLTLIDALDMLAIMGNNTEFERVANLVVDTLDFNQDINVSVFETNIRVVGGLLSAHLMYRKAGMSLEAGWPCTGPLLRLAEDVARRLLPAFDTPTGMPYGTVNLMHGVPKGETTITCTAGVGTMIVEFGALSKLTGDPIFEKVAMRAMKSLYAARSPIGLVGNHVDVASGKWTALDSGVGGGVDSYFEYLVKGSVMLQNTELLEMFNEHLVGVEKYLKRDDWYMWAHMTKGSISLPIFTSLDCYWPAIQSMLGDVDKAMKTIHNFHQVWKQFGFLPEFYNIVKNEAHAGREGYPLRPELVEAAMYLYKATGDPYLLEIGVDMMESIEHSTRTKCGYATVKNVNSHMLENRMESFFLAETVKYLYLLFDEDNFIHNTGDHGTIINTPNGQCIIETGSYIFNTEAHPIDTAALHCCSAEKKEQDIALNQFHDDLDLLTLFGISDNLDTVQGVKWTKTNTLKEQSMTEELSQVLEPVVEVPNMVKLNLKSHTIKVDNPPTINNQDVSLDNIQNVKITVKGNQVSVETQDDKTRTEDTSSEGETIGAGGDTSSEGETIGAGGDTSSEAGRIGKEHSVEETSVFDSDEQSVPVDSTHTYSTNTDKTTHSISNENIDKTVNKVSEKLSDKVSSKSEQTQPSYISKTPVDTQGKSDAGTVKDVIDLLKSFTKEILTNTGLKSIKSLHDKLKYYSLFHNERPELLTCKAQPYHMRYSIMGEMFLDN